MKKQKKRTIKVLDVTPSKDVTGGRRHRHGHGLQGEALAQRGDSARGLGPFGLNQPQ